MSRISLQQVEERLRNREYKALPVDQGIRQSAVLILLADCADGVRVLLTERSNDVRDHKGQVSFPGGVIDPDDADATAAAIREAVEEVGLDPSRLRLVGRIDDYVTITNYHITPVVGFLPDFEGLSPRTGELGEVFAFPIEWMLDGSRIERIDGRDFGRDEDVLFIAWEGHLIWGATARMLYSLLEIVR